MVRVSFASVAFAPPTKAPSRLVVWGRGRRPWLLLVIVLICFGVFSLCPQVIHDWIQRVGGVALRGFVSRELTHALRACSYFTSKIDYLRTQVGNPEGADKPVSPFTPLEYQRLTVIDALAAQPSPCSYSSISCIYLLHLFCSSLSIFTNRTRSSTTHVCGFVRARRPWPSAASRPVMTCSPLTRSKRV